MRYYANVSFLISILTFLIVQVTFSPFLHGSVKTLPEGVWSITTSYDFAELTKAAGETVNPDGSGQGDFKFYSINDYTTKYLNALQPLIYQGYLSGDIQIADYYRKNQINLNLAFGFTDQLTVSLDIPYVDKALKYTDSYVNSLKNIAPIIKSQGGYIPPTIAYGKGIGDLTLAAKYRVNEHYALGASFRGGTLKIGTDSKEKAASQDYFQALPTGKLSDNYRLALFYEGSLFNQPMSYYTAYEISTDGWENMLGNNYKINAGDTIYFGISSHFLVSDEISITPRITYLQSGADRKYVNNTWTSIENSETYLLLAEGTISYQVTRFLKTWGTIQVPILDKAAAGAYEMPGRISTDLVTLFGVTLYYL